MAEFPRRGDVSDFDLRNSFGFRVSVFGFYLLIMARWHSCNVLEMDAAGRRVWQFDAQKFTLVREYAARNGDALPASVVVKSWSSLFQPKLNVAWLPPENVFIRVAQFPQSNFEETRAMVEFQLEKLSPIPVTQASWTMHVMPHAAGNLQTVIVLVVARNVVEEFLGELEGQHFMADRLELPLVDQLQATAITEDGAWIYPEAQGGKNTALVAWWYGGVLHNLNLLHLSAGPDRVAGMREQLVQMAWAGELEGWLTSPPRWHLVADPAVAAEWEAPLREGLDQPVETSAPLPATELAALTARRSAEADPKVNLLPPEFVTRNQQQFVDRLWMRGLMAVLAMYGVCLLVYFVALGVFNFRTSGVENQVAGISSTYTNAMQLQELYRILRDRQELKFAALDCWEATAELMPPGITLNSMNFSEGRRVALSGDAPADQVKIVTDFCDSLRKAAARGQPIFDARNAETPHTALSPGGATVRWTYSLDLKRTGQL